MPTKRRGRPRLTPYTTVIDTRDGVRCVFHGWGGHGLNLGDEPRARCKVPGKHGGAKRGQWRFIPLACLRVALCETTIRKKRRIARRLADG